jgi:hypothetical protein
MLLSVLSGWRSTCAVSSSATANGTRLALGSAWPVRAPSSCPGRWAIKATRPITRVHPRRTRRRTPPTIRGRFLGRALRGSLRNQTCVALGLSNLFFRIAQCDLALNGRRHVTWPPRCAECCKGLQRGFHLVQLIFQLRVPAGRNSATTRLVSASPAVRNATRGPPSSV